MKTMRFAAVTGARDSKEVSAYLPDNYRVYGHRFPEGPLGPITFLIQGEDEAGWNLDDYVIPRLASGLMGCVEATKEVAFGPDVLVGGWEDRVIDGDAVVTVSRNMLLSLLEPLRLAYVYALKETHPQEIADDFKPEKWTGGELDYARRSNDAYRRLLDALVEDSERTAGIEGKVIVEVMATVEDAEAQERIDAFDSITSRLRAAETALRVSLEALTLVENCREGTVSPKAIDAVSRASCIARAFLEGAA